jgi:hypothetical protein
MLIASSHQRLLAVAVVSALVPVLLSAAPAETAKSKTVPSPADKVRDKLEQPVKMFHPVEQWTLKDSLEWLADRYALKFSVDSRAFETENIADVQATLIAANENWSLKDVKLKEVLRTILKKLPAGQSEATYVIVDDTIVITTNARAPYHWMRQLVNLDSEKEELAAALKKLARETGTNLALDPRAAKEAQTLVTLQMQDVALETVVSLLSEMAGLKPVRVDNTLFITSKANAKEMRADPERAHRIGPCPLPPD